LLRRSGGREEIRSMEKYSRWNRMICEENMGEVQRKADYIVTG
jgi:hypothetical protein